MEATSFCSWPMDLPGLLGELDCFQRAIYNNKSNMHEVT